MLIVYLEPLIIAQIELLNSWNSYVKYWPRSYAHTEVFNSGIPLDYWLLFNQHFYATKWLLKYPEQSRIIKTLIDDH